MESKISAFYVMPSFEPRSTVAVSRFCKRGGNVSIIRAVQFSESSSYAQHTSNALVNLGVSNIVTVDRRNSKSLWEWAWASVKDVEGKVAIDATCFTRELLGMLLFALSVKRQQISSIVVHYVATGKDGYATQNEKLPEDERWLTKGILEIRSIVGYPGDFSSERKRRVIALAGHESKRLLEILEFIEPEQLSIGNETKGSSTVVGAETISKNVADELRDRIPIPNINEVTFHANSINDTFESVSTLLKSYDDENVFLVPMNTKLSFIGAALAALQNRNVRMVYAVPEVYNPNYSKGAGKLTSHDITRIIHESKTTLVRSYLSE